MRRRLGEDKTGSLVLPTSLVVLDDVLAGGGRGERAVRSTSGGAVIRC